MAHNSQRVGRSGGKAAKIHAYRTEKQRCEALKQILELFSQRDARQVVRTLPETFASIFNSTASVFLLQPAHGTENDGQDAIVLQGTIDIGLRKRLGWIHLWREQGRDGWVGVTARRLRDAANRRRPCKVSIPSLPSHPAIDFPYRHLAQPLVTKTGKLIGLVWLVRPYAIPFSDEHLDHLRDLAGPVADFLASQNMLRVFQNVALVEAIDKVSLGIQQEVPQNTILRNILEEAAALLGARNGTLGVVNQKTGILRVKVGCGSLKDVRIPDLREGDPGITRYVVDSGTPYVCFDIKTDPHYFPSDPLTASEICVPILIGTYTIGNINLESEHKGHFSVEHERLLTLFALYAGAALVMAHRRVTYPLRALLQVGQELLLLSPSATHDEIFEDVVTMAAGIVKCDHVSIWLKDAAGTRIVLRGASDHKRAFIGQHSYDLTRLDHSGLVGEGLTGKVANGSIEAVRTAAAKRLRHRGWIGKYNSREYGHPAPPGSTPLMVMPLRIPNKTIIGAIKFSRTRKNAGSFGKWDELLALALAQEIAVILSAYVCDTMQGLIDIGRALILHACASELDTMLNKAVVLAREAIQCERTTIWLKENDGTRLTLRAACGGREKFVGKLFYRLDTKDSAGLQGEGLTGKIATGCLQKVRAKGARDLERKGWKGKYNTPEEGHAESPGSIPILMVPVRATEDIFGVIRFSRPYHRADRPQGFNEADERFAFAVAQLIAIALQVTRLIDEVKAQEQLRAKHFQELARLLGSVYHFISPKILPLQDAVTQQDSPKAFELILQLKALHDQIRFLTRGCAVSLHLNACPIEKILDKAVAENALRLQQSHVDVVRHYSTNGHLVFVDATLMQGVFSEIILNALDAIRSKTDIGPRQITLNTKYDLAQRCVAISIADTGCGTSVEQSGREIAPYQTTKPKGTGLGLPACRIIVERHKGTMKLSANGDSGSVVAIALPLADGPDTKSNEY